MAGMITWDEPKRLSNLAKHGLDFADLDEDFFLSAVIVPSYGGRQMAIGHLSDGTIAVVFAILGPGGCLGHLHAPGEPHGKEPAMTKRSHGISDAEEARI